MNIISPPTAFLDPVPKPWWRSRGVIGGAVATMAGLAGLVGIAIPTAEQTSLADEIAALSAAVGGILAILGRVRATRPIAPSLTGQRPSAWHRP